jgi:nicotinamidase-related amidase
VISWPKSIGVPVALLILIWICGLKSTGIHNLIVIGLIAHTCVEAIVRFAAELGYEVTMVKDATADYSDEEMHAALDVNIPNYASAIVTTNESSSRSLLYLNL